MGAIIEQNLVAVFTALVAFISAWAVIKSKVESLEKRMDENDKITNDSKLAIERRNEEMRDIHRRLNKIDDLKIEATLAEIKTELNHIRVLIEKQSQ